jgi:hypothetical protein
MSRYNSLKLTELIQNLVSITYMKIDLQGSGQNPSVSEISPTTIP